MPSADDRILLLLKTRGATTTAVVARHLAVTLAGARKHLMSLVEDDLVAFADEKGKVGRPRRLWRLTEKAATRFPDNHAFLTLELIGTAREIFGENGLDSLIARREQETLARYEARLKARQTLPARVAALCRIRTEEGYMAEWQRLPDRSLLLVENHCPICAAAKLCQGFCRSELDLFRHLLGPEATVERTDHILAGARRCAYRIAPA
ncbi:MAG: helix-turn-helix transcriptional regulator [Parvibaculaceae bacterium]